MLATNHHSQRGKKQIVVSCQLSVVSCQWSVVSGQWAVGSGQWMPVRGHPRCGATHCYGSVVPPNTNRSRGNTRGQPIVAGAGTPQWGHPTFAGPPEASRAGERDAGAGPPMANLVALRRGHPMPVGEQKRSRRFPPRFGMRPGRPTEHCPVHCNTGTASAKRGQPVGPPSADRWCHPTPIGRRGTRGGSLSWLGRGLLDGATQLWRDHPRPVGRENRMPVRGQP